MTHLYAEGAQPKAQWKTPVLVDLEMGLSDVQNGLNPGIDGNGGFTTSLS